MCRNQSAHTSSNNTLAVAAGAAGGAAGAGSGALVSGATPSTKVNELEVTSIVPYSKGFIASCGRAQAFLYEKYDDKELYRRSRELRIPPDANISDPSRAEEQVVVSMCISPSEETLLAVTNWQQIYELVFSNVDVGKVSQPENILP